MSVENDKTSGTSLEKGIAPTVHVARGNDRYHFDQSDLDRVQRRLKQRHVQMFVPLACLCVQSPSP
jgi:yeast amino acid transporter